MKGESSLLLVEGELLDTRVEAGNYLFQLKGQFPCAHFVSKSLMILRCSSCDCTFAFSDAIFNAICQDKVDSNSGVIVTA